MMLSDKKNLPEPQKNNFNGRKQEKMPTREGNAKKVLYAIKKTLSCHFPDLEERINQLIDPRQRKEYSLAEIVMSGVMLFFCKQPSRNKMDNNRRDGLAKSYWQIFKRRLPSMDATEDVFRKLDPDQLDQLKAATIAALIEKRVFHKFRFLGKYFVVAVDGTGVHSSEKEYWEECVHKTSQKTGTTTYMNMMLEAKLVTSTGIRISLCSEKIGAPQSEEQSKEYQKQDCEQMAFKRLAVKLKEYFPRLPICLVMDGLYCNAPVMDICKENQWEWIVTFKDGNLPSVHQELELLPQVAFEQLERNILGVKQSYTWCNNIEYKGHQVHWIRCIESKKGKELRMEYLSSIPITNKGELKNVERIVQTARSRWNIEDSFNDQKNRDFNMQHLFSRHNNNAFLNWYNSLQLAYNIYTLVLHSTDFEKLRSEQHSKQTIQNLWENFMGLMEWLDLEEIVKGIDQWLSTPRQVRLI